ncbi:glycoside hydrolase family 140 protein [Aggregatilinea lenta]|uniref:glycoside hydrolase family 140 protein n=1 Tax=Aggregatilinea lenta TaxID=913108 RepID=UPI000E5B3DF5|nr:glycoside hydrolase family 140 protein [Aggregatilinea lenta]
MRRIQVSENKRFLVYEDGTPFFWLGDTAWELFHRTTREEAEYYLENRLQKGFNVIKAVILAEFDGLHVPNAYGDLPLHDDDPARPNERYFRYVDTILDLAAEKGLYVGLLPTWGDKVNLMWGLGPVIFDDQNARAYGEFVGSRYASRPNVIWIIGGDRPEQSPDGADYSSVWRAMVSGIQSATNGKAFFTYHPMGQRSSAMGFHDDDWLHLNMWQSGHMARDLPNWEWIAQDYARTPVKPVLDGEPAYEDHPIDPFTRKWAPEYGRFRAYDVRKQAYRAVFAGACGHTYGHHSIWQMYSPERVPVNFPHPFWREALNRPGAGQMMFLRQLLEAWPYLTRVPDQTLLISEPGEGPYHVQATRASDGSYALVYIPTEDQTVRIDMSKFASNNVRIQWFDPRHGTTTPLGKIHGASVAEFTTPQEGPDWVLMLDCLG